MSTWSGLTAAIVLDGLPGGCGGAGAGVARSGCDDGAVLGVVDHLLLGAALFAHPPTTTHQFIKPKA